MNDKNRILMDLKHQPHTIQLSKKKWWKSHKFFLILKIDWRKFHQKFEFEKVKGHFLKIDMR